MPNDPGIIAHSNSELKAERQGELIKEKQDDKWTDVRRISAARSVQKPLLIPGVNSLNDFSHINSTFVQFFCNAKNRKSIMLQRN